VEIMFEEEEIQRQTLNVRQGCICPNGGNPIDGETYIDPCCKVHYAELAITEFLTKPDLDVSEEELADWQMREKEQNAEKQRRKKRVSYPKMTVAKR
jgi:hypothetical protein